MDNKWIGEGYYNNLTGIKIDELVDFRITLPKEWKENLHSE